MMPLFSSMRAGWLLLGVGLSMGVLSQPGTPRATGSLSAPAQITVRDGGLEYAAASNARTVQTFLNEQHIIVGENDIVAPDTDARLLAGGRITILRATPFTIFADGKTVPAASHAQTIGKALEELGVTLGPSDRITPERDAVLSAGVEIRIVRVAEAEKEETAPLAFPTIFRDDPELSFGKTKVLEKGVNGKEQRTYRMRYENGELVIKKLISKEIVAEPVPEIIARGTKIAIGRTQEGGGSWYRFRKGLFAASTTFPRGAFLRVTNLENGKQVIVKVNDYGPTIPGRVIDLEATAFQQLAPLWKGVIQIRVEELL